MCVASQWPTGERADKVLTEEELQQGFWLGEWQVLPSRRLLRSVDKEESPEPLVFDFLLELAKRDGDLVTKDELIEALWDGRPTADEPIARAVAQLRGHLGDRDKPRRYIETLQKQGYRLKEKVVLERPATKSTKLIKAIGALVLVGIVAVAVINLTGSPPPASSVTSIGVLPFVNVSGAPDNQYLVEGFQSELGRALQVIPNVDIKTARNSYVSETASDIAALLDVDSVLFGSVNRNGDELMVSYELVDGTDNVLRVSGSMKGRAQDIFDFQVEVATAVYNDIVGTPEQFLVSASRPSNSDAYDKYLKGLFAFDRRGNGDNLEQAMRFFEETIRLDPTFGPAYLNLATAYVLLPVYRGAPLEDSDDKAILLVEQGIAADESIRDAAGAVSGFIYHRNKNWTKSEFEFQKATNAMIIDSNSFIWYSRMLASVGRLDAALEQALLAFKLDPESPVVNSRVALSYSWLGKAQKASEFFDRASRLGAEGTTHLMGWALFLAREGDVEKASEIAKIAATQAGLPPGWIDPVISGMLDEEMKMAALQEVNQAVKTTRLPAQIEIVVRTLLGDIDGAMEVAQLLENPGEAFEMDLLWIPEFVALRQHPAYLPLMERLGIVEYWQLNRCSFYDVTVSCRDDAS